jgi:hypothetical protein
VRSWAFEGKTEKPPEQAKDASGTVPQEERQTNSRGIHGGRWLIDRPKIEWQK